MRKFQSYRIFKVHNTPIDLLGYEAHDHHQISKAKNEPENYEHLINVE